MAEATPRKLGDDHWKSLANSSHEADALRQESIKAHHDHLITEIETSDGPLATALRAVYDSDELPRFQNRLCDRIKSHDKEIERMCNYHYQGFIDSVRELQLVSGDAAKLKDEIENINCKLHESCAPLIGKGEELIRCRHIQKNIATAVESLSLCLPVLEMYGKLQEQMKAKRYYPALKTLEQLEHTYLPRVMNHWFSHTMAEAIPRLREKIKEASMTDLKDFLESIRKHSSRIGEVAMLHAAEQNNMDPGIAKRKRRRKKAAPPPPNPFTGEIDIPPEAVQFNDDDDEDKSAQDLVDFSPVYRCLHIYTVLDDREKFETYYRKQRRYQARLCLEPPTHMHESIENFQQYFHDIVGSFVIEDHILSTTQGLVNRAYMDESWQMAVSKLVSALRSNIVLCKEAELLLKIKKLIVLFCHTVKGYGFTISLLLDFLLEMRAHYIDLLMRQWVDVFNEIFMEDNYTPIYIENEADYQSVIAQFPFKNPELQRAMFPKKFPFSQFVPNIYNQVKAFINASLKFSADLHLSNTEIDDMIRKSANILLTDTLSNCLSNLIKRPEMQLLQLIQIAINMNYLEKSCGFLEEHISTITGAEKDSIHAARLQGISMFKGAQNDAEGQIYQKINDKMDDFIELASYSWNLSELRGVPSDYIKDLIAFLRDTFVAFEHLPEKLAQTACMSACKHIASTLMGFLLDDEVPQMTNVSLEQFELDVLQCEQFAASNPVSGYADGTLLLVFADLRQLLDLLLTEDWSTYLSDYGKQKSKYNRVKPNDVITLLEKLNNYDKKKGNIFASLKKNEREKRKLLDTVLKQLRGLANGTMQSQSRTT